MALNAKTAPQAGGNFVEQSPLEAGLYPARVVQVIDLGMQKQRPYQGKDKPPAHCVMLTYELSHEFLKDEDGNDDGTKPKWLTEDFPLHNLKADRARSTQRYNALDPSGMLDGDFLQLASMSCQVMVTKTPDKKNEGEFKNYVGDVSGAMNVPGYEQPALVNPTKVFDLDTPTLDTFDKFPEWLQERIKGNLEYAGSPLAVLLGDSNSVATTAPAPSPEPVEAPAPPPAAPEQVAPPAPAPA